MSLREDLPVALRGAWLAVALAGGAVLLTSFIAPSGMFSLLPECEAHARGGACLACGMTTGFLEIARGDFEAAARSNAGALPLYAALALNFLAAIAFAILSLVRRHRTGGHTICKSSP